MNKKVEKLVEEKFKERVQEHIVAQVGVPTTPVIDMEAKKAEVEEFFRSMIAEVFDDIIKRGANAGVSEEQVTELLMTYCEENYQSWVDSFINAKKMINPGLFKSQEKVVEKENIVITGKDEDVVITGSSAPGNIVPGIDVTAIENKKITIDESSDEEQIVDPNAGASFDPIEMLKNLGKPATTTEDAVAPPVVNNGNAPHSMKFEL